MPTQIRFHLDHLVQPERAGDTWSCRGWAFPIDAPVGGTVRARIGTLITCATGGQPRPDVAIHYPDQPGAAYSGFSIAFPTPLASTVLLEVQDHHGQWHEFWRQTSPPRSA